MGDLIFWDVDTQRDFILPDGKLYIDGAEKALPNLARLTRYAREQGIRVAGSVDAHSPDDPELSDDPDLTETFPPHCIEGTDGCKKVVETAPLNPLWIPNEPQDEADLRAAIESHDGEIYLKKRRFDVFTNPNTTTLLDALEPTRILVYGVALDVCDAHAIEGFLARGDVELFLALDATRAIVPENGERLVADWRKRGVRIVSTEQVVSGGLDG